MVLECEVMDVVVVEIRGIIVLTSLHNNIIIIIYTYSWISSSSPIKF